MGFKILEKEEFGKSGTLFKFIIDTPLIAKKANAGNFSIKHKRFLSLFKESTYNKGGGLSK